MTTIEGAVEVISSWALGARGDWDAGRLDGAIAAARTAHWDDLRICLQLVRMVFDPSASPRDLMESAREPVGPHNRVPASPEFAAAAMADMRASLNRSCPERGAA